MQEVNFRRIRDPQTRKPIGCLAYKLKPAAEAGKFTEIVYGWSMCNPSDQWNWERGKQIAEARMTRFPNAYEADEAPAREFVQDALRTMKTQFDYDPYRSSVIRYAIKNLQVQP